MAERIEAEITLSFKDFSTAVDSVIRDSQKMSQSAGAGISDFEKIARAKFSEIAKDTKIAENGFRELADNVNKSVKKIQLDELQSKFSGIAKIGGSIFSSTLDSGANFEEGLLRINTIAKLNQEELASLGTELRKTGQTIGVSTTPVQTLASFYDVLSSGFTKTADASRVLEASLRLSAGGQADAAETTRALTGILNAYGETSDKAALRADQFFQTVNLGVTTVPELSKSLGLVTSTAASAGVSVEELLAAIATLTLRGQTTSSSIEGVRAVIASLITPTAGAQKELDRLGIVVNANTLAQDGLLVTLNKIQAASGGQVDSINKIIEGQVGLASALGLSKDNGVLYQRTIEGITNSNNASVDAQKEVNKGVNEGAKAFKSALESLKISSSESFLPISKGLLSSITGIVERLDSIPAPVKTAGLAFVGFGTAVALAAGGIAGLSFAATAVSSQFVLLGVKYGPAVVRVFSFLKTPVTVATAALARNSFAMLGNTGAAIRNATAQGVLTGAINLTRKAATASIAPFSGLALLFGGIALGIGALANEYLKLEQSVNASNEAILKSGDLKNFGRKAKSNKELSTTRLLGTSAKDLAKEGVTRDDVTQRILDQQRQVELAQDSKNQEQEKKARDRLKRLVKLRSDLASEIEKIEKEASKKRVIIPKDPEDRGANKTAKEETREQKQALKDQQKEIRVQTRLELAEQRKKDRDKKAQEKALSKALATQRRSDRAIDAANRREQLRKEREEKKAEARSEKIENASIDNRIDQLSGARDSITAEKDFAKQKAEILNQLAEVGIASIGRVKNAQQEALALRLKEIDLEKDLAKAKATTAEEVATIEKRSSILRIEAENESERAIQKTIDAMKAQKEEARKGSGATNLNLGGGPFSLSEFSEQSSGFLDITTIPKFDKKEVARQRRILNAIVDAPSPIRDQISASRQAARASDSALKSVAVDVTLFDPQGNVIPSQIRKAVVDGKNTEASQIARTFR